MSKKLIIAEKPSVAGDIAKALGGFTRHGDYYESNDLILSSAVGHLLQLVAPDTHEVKRGKWSFANLPVIPPHFDLKPIERSEDRLKVLVKLLKRKDVIGIVNACDAGREGELIFRYILQHAGINKPIERLWLQSMTQASICTGFDTLRKDKDMLPLADAAVCRSESDWLIGINGTRAMTAFNSKEGGFYKTTVGRVQTPTLAVLVEREQRIRSFVPRDYWEVHGTFSGKGGEYKGRWFDESFSKEAKAENAELRAERIWNAAQAAALRAKCEGQPGLVEEESKPTTQAAAALFDLTSLQREANGRFGFSAKTTLSIAQALYEKHKVLTYPRTDSKALPEDYIPTVLGTMKMLSSGPYAPFAKEVIKNEWVKPNKRVFNNAKISDHHAIIPTLQAPKALSEIETKLYDLVVKRFLAVFFPSAEFLVTMRITRVKGEPFRSEGRVMVAAGWLAIYGKEAETGEAPTLAPVLDGKVSAVAVEVLATQTRPPTRLSEATLLSAMEGAGKLIDDDELREAMSEKGLGTPATRASIIEGLIYEDYVHRNGRELVPSPKAFSLLFALGHLGITELASPELTGNWEFKLRQIEQGKLDRSEFMDHIVETARDMVARIKGGNIPDDAFLTLQTPCPKCSGKVVENYRKFQCQKCDFTVWKVMSSREFAPEEIETLITEKAVGPLQGFRSRLGRPFAATMKLSPEFKAEFDFGSDAADSEAVDFSGMEPLGMCPKCSNRVFELPVAYACEKSVGPAKNCDFRSGKIILQQPVSREQMQRLLETGSTDLFTAFISNKNRRKFSAFLVRDPAGKVVFKFQDKKPRVAGTTATVATAKEPPAKRSPSVAKKKPAVKKAPAKRKTA